MRTAMSKKSNKSITKYSESFLVRLEVGTLARVDQVLERFEGRSHMLREAIEREIKRRQRQPRDQ
jgi:hypothetical protein